MDTTVIDVVGVDANIDKKIEVFIIDYLSKRKAEDISALVKAGVKKFDREIEYSCYPIKRVIWNLLYSEKLILTDDRKIQLTKII